MSTPFLRELKTTLRLAWPIMGAQLLILGMVFTDNVMVARLGEEPLAALAMGGALYSTLLICAIGVLSALSPIVSQLHGAEELASVGKWMRQGWRLALLLSLLGVIVLLNAGTLLVFLGQKPALAAVAGEFLGAIAWGLPAQYLFFCGRILCEATHDSRPSVVLAALGALANAFLDYGLIYGHWGLPALGVRGSGYATAIVQWLMFAALVAYLLGNRRYRGLTHFFGRPLVDRKLFGQLLRLGLPISGGMLAEMCFFAGATLVIGWFGSRQLASHQIAINAASFTFMIPLGLSSAVAIRVGHYLGKGDPAGSDFAGRVGFWLTLAIQSVPALIFLFFPGWITGIYTSDPLLTEPAKALLRVGGIFQIFDGLQVVGIGALRGRKDTRVPFFNTLLSFWVIGAPAALVLAYGRALGPLGIWYGMVLGLGVASFLHISRFLRRSAVREESVLRRAAT